MRSLILSLALVFIFSATAFCHNPSDINIAFKKEGIDLTVSHSVSDPAAHYVKKIEVKLNQEKIAELKFTSQTDGMAQKASLDIPSLKPGDVLLITAYCSRYGEVTKSVVVE